MAFGEVVGELLPLAVGVAVSPVPVHAVLAMAPERAGGFRIGWVVGSLAVLSVCATVRVPAVSWVKIVLGVVLLVLSALQWRRHQAVDDPPVLPKWTRGLDAVGAVKATALGVALVVLTPKNLVLLVAGGLVLGAADLGFVQDAVAVLVFVVVAAPTVVIPADRYGDVERTRAWLVRDHASITAVLLLVLGVVLIGRGF
ncbi:GAP family protein [Actinokineospora enzanensis]|uniref:GAP family protein n=1 Tax=Actinokineospora enzanensis TaxID=155975 RepID=UPI00035F723C|nr:GAP family protein [Actinokineospora enzanensis]